jgi:hypothetical protein
MLKNLKSDDAVFEAQTGKTANIEDTNYSNFMNNKLVHVSGYVGLFSINAGLVKSGIKCDRHRWKKIKERKTNRPFWIAGNYELELVNFKLLLHTTNEDNAKKQKQIRQIYDYSKQQGWIVWHEDAALLLHWHGISNASKDTLTEVIGSDYYMDGTKLYNMHESGLFVQKFHLDKPFKKNLDKISSYGIKNATRYKHSFIGSDAGDELMLKQELSDLVSTYDEVQGRNWRSLMLSHTIG